MLNVDYDGESSGVGAGIVFANEKDRVLIATASHVILKGTTPAKNIFVRFKAFPDKLLPATVLKQVNKGESLDLAVLSVANLAAQGINPCAFPFARLPMGGNLERKDEVFPLGNPNGRAWALAVDPDKISEITEAGITFQSINIKSGHSGGALIDDKANLIGLVTADEAPLGYAMTIDAVANQLKQWNFPVMLGMKEYRENKHDLPMHVAADSGNISELKKLLARCFNPNEVDYHYRTPLHYSASRGDLQACSLLVKSGAMIDVQDFSEMYPLSLAISGNHLETVKFLVKSGAKIENRSLGKNTALHWSLQKDVNPQIALYLIQAGANVNALDEENDAPLHYAASIGNPEIVNALIKAGANVRVKNAMQATPLELATAVDNVQIMQALIKSGAESGPKSLTDLLHLAVSNSNNTETVKFLLKAGARVNEKVETGYTALHFAVDRAMRQGPSFIEFVKVLLEAGADPNAKNNDGKTPLSYAENPQEYISRQEGIEGRSEAIQALLRKYGGK